jgi:3-hydroxyacyl-[acyl-carrier-protein] dehydratase
MENNLGYTKIKEILPQRYPFLFIDKVLSVDREARKAVCCKNFSINDYFFKGHFPGNPIVPGAIIIEAMAQASIILYAVLKPEIAKQHPDYYFGKVEAKFKKPVLPGDSLHLEVAALKLLQNNGIVEAIAKVKDDVVAEATIAFGVKPKPFPTS